MKSVALIGIGMVSSVYVDAIHDLRNRLKLSGILGGQPESGQKFLKQHGRKFNNDVKVYSSVAEIANDSSVDFVILATPPNHRIEPISQLIETNKPVLMEKPIERTLKTVRKIVEMFKTADLPAGVMLQHRIRPSVTALNECLASQDFGRLHLVETYVPWWRHQSYYDEPGRGTYSRDGGGVLISQAIHTLDLTLTFTGPVNSVVAHFATSGFHKMESEDTVTAGLTYENGAVGTLFASTSTYPGRTEEIHLHYEKASIRLQSGLLEINHQDGKFEKIGINTSTGAGADPMAFTSDWHRDVISNFLDVIDGIAEPIANLDDALKVHSLIRAMELSAQQGRRIEIGDMGDFDE